MLYISDMLLPHATATRDLEAIVAVSRRNNKACQISGALMVTDRHFVQFLEGPAAALEGLLAALHADRRHHNLRVLEDGPAVSRRFAQWSLAYCGPHDFVAGWLDDASRVDLGADQARDDLIAMMAAFAGAALLEGDGDDALWS